MKKVLCTLAVAVTALAVAGTAAAAPTGGWLSMQRGKSQIRSYLVGTQIGDDFRSKLSVCHKPTVASVRCFFETAEWTGYEFEGDDEPWLLCYGTAVAKKKWWGVSVTMNRGWTNDCYYDSSPAFLP